MKKNILVIIFCLLSLMACDFLDEESQKEKLQKRFDRLSGLNERLESKREEMLSLHESFIGEIDNLRAEIQSITQKEELDSYSEAINHPRIKYDLKLIQQKQAYLVKLMEFQRALSLGGEEVLFLTRKIEGDLLVAEVLDQKKLDELIEEIDFVINEYLPYADELVIGVDSNELDSKQEIWEDILADNNNLKLESKEIIKKEKYFNNFRIIKMIKNGEMDFDWYYNIQHNAFDLESDICTMTSAPELFTKYRYKYSLRAEKLIFIKPFVVLGVIYTTKESEMDFNGNGFLLDSRGVRYNPLYIIGAYWEKRFEQNRVSIIKGEEKRVFYIFPYIEPEKLKSGAFTGRKGKYLTFTSKEDS
ncbi:hypothetical protein KAJ89_04645 [Candidatus Parcubacteria bacterium]|nr:hypothetical protein [Candidatus Parcubacteria bacterium]